MMATRIDEELIRELKAGEARNVEFKRWLKLDDKEHIAILVKSVIAMYHENGGRIYIGINDNGTFDTESNFAKDDIYQKQIIECLQQYCNFPCEVQVDNLKNANNFCVLVQVPASVTTPIFIKKEILIKQDNKNANITKLKKNTLYMRTYRENNKISSAEAKEEDFIRLINYCVENKEKDIAKFIRRNFLDEEIKNFATVIKSILEQQ